MCLRDDNVEHWCIVRIRSTREAICYLNYRDREPALEWPAVWTMSEATARPATVQSSVTVHQPCKSAKHRGWSVATTICHRSEGRAKGSINTKVSHHQQQQQQYHDINNNNNNNSSNQSTLLLSIISGSITNIIAVLWELVTNSSQWQRRAVAAAASSKRKSINTTTWKRQTFINEWFKVQRCWFHRRPSLQLSRWFQPLGV